MKDKKKLVKKSTNKVAKALSPEEKTIVDNIMSLAQELSAGDAGEEEVAGGSGGASGESAGGRGESLHGRGSGVLVPRGLGG